MEENNTMMELEQMREQMQVLRNKLDTQEIVNEKLVKNSVKSKMSWIKKLVYFELLLVPFTALMMYTAFRLVHPLNIYVQVFAATGVENDTVVIASLKLLQGAASPPAAASSHNAPSPDNGWHSHDTQDDC